jgi:hypothetical protein
MRKGLYCGNNKPNIFRNDWPSHGDDRKTFEVMTSTQPLGTLASLLSATLCQGNHDGNHKLWNLATNVMEVKNILLTDV